MRSSQTLKTQQETEESEQEAASLKCVGENLNRDRRATDDESVSAATDGDVRPMIQLEERTQP